MEANTRWEAVHPVGEGQFTFPMAGGRVRLAVTNAPLEGEGTAMFSAKCNTPAMARFILEMMACWPDHRLLCFLNGAGWYKSKQLPFPKRLRLELLPAYTPEYNPAEHVWDEVR